MKYTKEFKLECIRKRKEEIQIETPPGYKNREGFMRQVRKWEVVYRFLGEAGLEHGRPTLDIDQRQELIKRVEAGESYISVALSPFVSASVSIVSYFLVWIS